MSINATKKEITEAEIEIIKDTENMEEYEEVVENGKRIRRPRVFTGETCFNCLTSDDYCSIYTTERWCKTKILEWIKTRPNEVRDFKELDDGGVTCKVPKSWMMKISPKSTRTFSEEQKKAAGERMKKAREKRKALKEEREKKEKEKEEAEREEKESENNEEDLVS